MTTPDNAHEKPCQCWTGPVTLHAGGCCFDWPDPDRTIYRRGGVLPCGHTEPAS